MAENEIVVESTDIVVQPVKPGIDPAAIEAALMRNDYGRLPVAEKVALYRRTCESMGLNPLTQPFGFFKMSGGSEVLYAKRTAADQLRQIHGITLVDCSEAWDKDSKIFSVTVRMRETPLHFIFGWSWFPGRDRGYGCKPSGIAPIA